jgi:hypothetical protein
VSDGAAADTAGASAVGASAALPSLADAALLLSAAMLDAPPAVSAAAAALHTALPPYAPPMGCAAAALQAQDRAAAYSLLPPYLRDCAVSVLPPAQLPLAAPAAPAAASMPAPMQPPLPPPPPPMKECCVCLEDVAADDMWLVSPCGHRCVCEACGEALMAMPRSSRKCPKCRAGVERVMRVFEE